MATPLTDSQFRAAAEKWDLDYEFYPGAVGRPGSFTPIGFIIHHTGGPFTESISYLDFLFKIGRPSEGIPAQLCQFSGGPSGKIYAGKINARANHAGAGFWKTRQLVGGENYNGYNTEIQPGADDFTSGNGLYYGLEINYPGTVPMKAAQWKSAVRLGALLMDAHGWTALSCIGHREHSRRKWDPGSVFLYEYRKAVRDLLDQGPGGQVKVWDQTLGVTATARPRFPENYSLRAEHVATHILGLTYEALYGKLVPTASMKKKWPSLNDEGYSGRVYARGSYNYARDAYDAVRAMTVEFINIHAGLAANNALLQQILAKAGTPVDMKAIESAAKVGAEGALATLNASIVLNLQSDPGDE